MSALPSLSPLRATLLRLAALALTPLCALPTACADTSLPPGARLLRDVSYVKNGHTRQKLDLYLPAAPTGPLIVWIHGGGWREGSKANPPGLAALTEGVAVASLAYRFSQDAVFPAQIEDCKAAIRWLRAHAAEHGYDPQQVCVWGASAGGHLAALLATTGHVQDFDVGENLDQPSRIQCAVNWFGPSDFPGFQPPNADPAVQRKGPASLLTQLLGGDLTEKLELAKRASPLTWVTKAAAPMLILHGTEDPLVPVSQSQRLAEALKASGVEVQLEVIEGAGHGGPEFTTPARLRMMREFIVRHIAR
jgi:acetyl esterase/lipase